MLTRGPRGTNDILPVEVFKWQHIEKVTAEICGRFGYKEIRTPVFEHTELFERGVGETTDIVQKEMYTFQDKGGRSITLRPEGTAGIVRSYIEHGMSSQPLPVKLYYNISAYRYESVQKGRYREFHQFGAEAFGSPGPDIDVEIISLIVQIFNKLGISGLSLHINSIGCPVCRRAYNEALKQFLSPVLPVLCDTCRDRFDRNPLRILDCKVPECRANLCGAPVLLDYLCDDCSDHFKGLTEGLNNINIGFVIDNGIVRGLDYYTKTIFEFVSDHVGTQKTVCGGGRYDGLIEECGGTPTPGIGFGLGIERLLMEMESQDIAIPEPGGIDIFISTIGANANRYAGKLVNELRAKGISAEKDLMDRSLKAQMKYADKLGATYTVIIGDDEINSNKAILKNMKTSEQKDISLDTITDRLVRFRE